MRMPALILTVMAATLLVGPARPQDNVKPPRKEPTPESAKKVKELRKERVAVLKELTDQLTQLYQRARVEIDVLLEARVQLVQAEVDAAEKLSDRLAFYKNLVEELRQYEKIAQGRAEAGRGAMTAVLRIRARRLEAEIHLEEATAGKSDGERRKPVVGSPQVKNVTITQQYLCQIHAQRHTKIRALQKGIIEAVPVTEGQAVKQGDLIFRIVPNLYKAKLDAALAEVKIADVEFRNTERLFQNKVVGPDELTLFKTKLEKAKARAELARAELNFTEVRAPFDGMIDRLHEQQGSMINEGETFTTLSDNSALWVYFDVPQAHYLEYAAGAGKDTDGKIVLVLANGRTFKQSGKISAIEAQFNNVTGNIPFRADFPNPDRLLRHGMTGTVLMHRTVNNAVVIPQRATFETLDKRYVYVVGKGNVAHRREIVVQDAQDDFFVIAQGVGANDRIIVDGIQQVQDGERVEFEIRAPDQTP